VALAYHAAAGTIPALADRLASARQVGRFVGTGDTDGFFRAAFGPGWALLGDAGYHKDPITAQGMTDALLHAEVLAEAIVDGLGGVRSLNEALADFNRRRDALARPIYAMTTDMALLAPPPSEMASLIAALRDDRAGTSRFLGIMAGTVAPSDFFAEHGGLEPAQAA
jgi:flavin-dependent dehydrogenase